MKILIDGPEIFEAWECLCRLSNFAWEKLDERERANLNLAKDILTKTLNASNTEAKYENIS